LSVKARKQSIVQLLKQSIAKMHTLRALLKQTSPVVYHVIPTGCSQCRRRPLQHFGIISSYVTNILFHVK